MSLLTLVSTPVSDIAAIKVMASSERLVMRLLAHIILRSIALTTHLVRSWSPLFILISVVLVAVVLIRVERRWSVVVLVALFAHF